MRFGSVYVFNSSYWEQCASYIFESFRSYCEFDITQVVHKEPCISLFLLLLLFFFNKACSQI